MRSSLPSEMRRRVQRALRTRDFRRALRSSTGAIDLASIVVGVIVIGVIAEVVATTVFAVILWAQNNAAKANLDAVRTAEGVTRVQDGRYADMAVLLAASRIQATTTTVSVATDAAGTCYIAVSKSAIGKVSFLTDRGPDVKGLTHRPVQQAEHHLR